MTLIFLLMIVLLISAVNATEENDNYTSTIEESNMMTSDISVNPDNTELIENKNPITENNLKANDANIYFNSSVDDDGNGSITNPWKTITSNRLNSISQGTAHIANGNYTLNNNIIISSNLTISGEDMNSTVISCGRYYIKVNYSNKVTIANLTFKDSTVGAMKNSGNLALDYVKFENNTNINGGAINNEESLTVTNSYFNNNTAEECGSAIYHNYYGKLEVINSTFIDNSGKWGAIYTTSSDLNVTNCTFINDYSYYGGAIFIDKRSSNIIQSSRFINCTSYSYGGAIAIRNSTSVKLYDNEFINDSSFRSTAGAIYIDNTEAILENNIFTDNSALIGGAISTLNSFTNITNNNFTNNKAKYYGGAIFDSYTDLKIVSSSFKNNSAKYGGAIYILSIAEYLNISQSLFDSNNADITGGAIYSDGNTINIINNKFENNYAKSKLDLYHDHEFKLNLENNTWSGSKTNITIQTSNIAKTLINITNITVNVDSIPSYYDLREHGGNVTIKDQTNGGNCWSFATLESLESAILLNTGNYYDLSENNQKNIMALYSKYGFHIFPNDGGYDAMALGYLTSWLGPILEINDTYDDYDTVSAQLDTIIKIQDIYGVSRFNYTANDEVKRAIMKYGSVYTSMYMDQGYYNYNTNTHGYYTMNGRSNHAVSVIGWNDSYSKSNFRTTPPGDGAWIVKNSWGTEWGDNGYFYVSYYDYSFLRTSNNAEAFPENFVIVLNSSKSYDKNYQYDNSGYSEWSSIDNSKVSYYNNYVAEEDEIIKAFGTYVHNIGTDYIAEVYVNGEKKYTQNGSFDFSGFETIELNQEVNIKQGDSFKIVLTISNPNKNIIYYPIANSSDYRLFTYANKSFVVDGNTELDLNSYNCTASLKVYTNVVNKTNTVMNILTTYDELTNESIVTVNLKDEYDNPITTGIINVYKENELIKTFNLTNEQVIIDKILNVNGLHNLTIDYIDESNTFKPISHELPVKVKLNLINTTIRDITYVEEMTTEHNITINGTVYDQEGNYITTGNVVLYENDTVLETIEINNGTINIIHSFNTTGTHNLTVVYNDYGEIYKTSNYTDIIINIYNTEPIITNLTITPDTITDGDIVLIKTIVTDQYGNPIKGSLIYKLNGKDLVNRQNRPITSLLINGVAELDYTMPSPLTERYYTFTVILTSTSDHNSTSKNITISKKQETAYINSTYSDNVTVLTDEIITVDVHDENGNPINEGQVKVFDEETLINTSSLTGTSININHIFNQIGTHTLTIVYENSTGQYTAANKTITIEVNPIDTNITEIRINPTTITSGDEITITTVVVDKNGNNVTDGYLIYKLNGQTLKYNSTTIIGEITNGIATIKYITTGQSGRTYTLTVKYTSSSGNYNGVSTDTNLTINKSPTNINIANARVEDNKIKINATLTDKNGNLLIGSNTISFKINGITLKDDKQKAIRLTINNGQLNTEIDLPAYLQKSKGIKEITLITGERNAYLANTTKTDLNIYPTTTQIKKIDIRENRVIGGDTITITTTITKENGEPVPIGYVYYKLNGQTLKENNTQIQTTVTNGTTTLTYTLPTGLSSKNYTITAYYNGYAQYTTSTANKTLFISKSNTTIAIKNTRIEDNKIYINATLKDENGNLLKGTNKISIKINDVALKNDQQKTIVVESQNGILQTTITLPTYLQTAKSIKNITLITGERNAYLSTRTTTNIKIYKINTTINKITVTPTVINAGKTIKIITTITKENGEPVPIGYVYYKLNGLTLKENNTQIETTVTNGTTTLTYTLPANLAAGNYTITAKYVGHNQYNVSSKDTTIKLE